MTEERVCQNYFLTYRVSKDLVYQHYFVAYLDLLGQSEILRKMSRIPTTPEEENEFVQNARRTALTVRDVRDATNAICDHADRRILDVSSLPADDRATFEDLRNIKYTMYGLSDATVIAVPLGGDEERCKVVMGVARALSAVCAMAGLAFSHKIPFRGGLDIGTATLIYDKEVYGSALEKAVTLEKKADWRFLAGTALLDFLDLTSSQEPRTRFDALAKRTASRCRRMIMQDTDGQYMADFIGQEVKGTLGAALPCDFFTAGYAFVLEESEKFHKDGNEKLAQRYDCLVQYYTDRKKTWSV